MNKHILLVMKWLKNPDSVSKGENKSNATAAAAAYVSAYVSAAAAAAAADAAADAAYDDNAADSDYWVNEFFKVTGEKRDDYEKALEEKPKRVKVEYVKVDISDVGFSDIADLFFMESDGNFVEIGGIDAAKLIADKWKLHRRIETEITERDEFIEKVEAIAEDITSDSEWSFACIATAMFDSGEFKLTKGE
tara:strand:- start:1571 stop:2146 length:576 start_codon:yes stop_codon:yes gene_type:complete